MELEEFGRLMLEAMPFEPTDQQIKLAAALTRFCSAYTPQDSVFILNGYAGTGKTSVMGALVRSLHYVGIPTVLLASTGRAAKVLSGFTGLPAFTIHRQIYSSPVMGPDGRFAARLNHNPHVNTVFIVDEASMIGEESDTSANSLLHDLVMYVYSGVNCRLILLGDTAQLPPVGCDRSPAMDPLKFKELGLRVSRATITKTVRQQSRSGILYNATWLRRAMLASPLPEPMITASPFADIAIVEPEDLEDALQTSFSTYGEEQTIIITRSNRRAAEFNRAIRSVVYDREDVLSKGERLVLAKNNYFWTRGSREVDFLANGETAVVEEIYSTELRGAITFADVRLFLPDRQVSLDAKINLEALASESAALPPAITREVMEQTLAEAGVTGGSVTAQRKALRECPYYNALQAKYAYAVTCHKAQGGQWASVFVDMGYIPVEAYGSLDFYRWLYTAVTRATTRLTFINPAVAIK
ncbi:MAG: ATP-dependent RecD-like DNA helicase [Muribaculaceae bacterium]